LFCVSIQFQSCFNRGDHELRFSGQELKVINIFFVISGEAC